ncbi:MAG: DUF3352 domain-containing protein [Cyanobacteria bacterium K_Offshore_surface_m2_239]|nr:DUF3352 domain-containing protein [Cyanobacteria bacterium K_Offshore_surface_m2_239]
MKGRPFLAVLLVVALLTLGLGWGGWWLVWRRSPLQLQRQILTVPRAARFVPRQAPLSLFVFSDGEQPVNYARAVAPLRQRDAATRAVERLRDGAFAAAGLDYHDELAPWLAPEVALALFDTPDTPAGSGWLLILHSKDSEGARRFLQRFWQSRSLAGSGLQVSQYRGMGLISGRGALVGRDPVPLATALVEDDLVLLASGRTTLERALDVSQIDELNQAGLAALGEGVDRLGEGMALLVARSGALGPWLGLPSLDVGERGSGPLLIGALQPRGQELVLEGLLQRLPAAPAGAPSPAEPPLADQPSPADQRSSADQPADGSTALTSALIEGLGADSLSLALLRNPAALLAQPWLTPLLDTITQPPGGGPLPPLLAAKASGPLLVSMDSDGWLIGTSRTSPPLESLEAPLAAQGLIDAPLDIDGDNATVWTRLQVPVAASGRSAGGDELRASVVGWRQEREELAWWGSGLERLQHTNAHRGGGGGERQRQLASLGMPQAPLRWAMGREAAIALLGPWRPWTLLSSLAGDSLSRGVQGLAVAVEPDATPVRWIAQLQFGAEPHG